MFPVTRNNPEGIGGRCVRLTTYHHYSAVVNKSRSLNSLGSLRACYGCALPLQFTLHFALIFACFCQLKKAGKLQGKYRFFYSKHSCTPSRKHRRKILTLCKYFANDKIEILRIQQTLYLYSSSRLHKCFQE